MSNRDGVRTAATPQQCLHKRLLEGVRNGEGKKTDTMKCCECGALVPPLSQKPPP
jgi:hypothetical protein